MAKERGASITGLDEIEAHDYQAARSYLLLIHDAKRVNGLIAKLRKAPITEFKAKDIFRASQLSVLGISNFHVEKDRARIRKGKPLCSVLLVRDPDHGKVIIAYGYHRVCAVYGFDEDALIHCKIV